ARESRRWITATVAAGLKEAGVAVESAGVLTTPGVAYLARMGTFAAGIVISASHNPWTDNGIKVFAHDGYKLSDAAELEIEREIFSLIAGGSPPIAAITTLEADRRLHLDYVKWLLSSVDASYLQGITVVVDCANGAASTLAAEVFRACGVKGFFTHQNPDGRNINEVCGALHPEVV